MPLPTPQEKMTFAAELAKGLGLRDSDFAALAQIIGAMSPAAFLDMKVAVTKQKLKHAIITKGTSNGPDRRTSTTHHGGPADQSGARAGRSNPIAGFTTLANTIFGTLPPTKPTEEIPHAGIRAGEITGWRSWWVMPHKFVKAVCNMQPLAATWKPEDLPEITSTVKHMTVVEPRLCSLAHQQLWSPGETITGDVGKLIRVPDSFDLQVEGGVYAWASLFECMDNTQSLLRNWQHYRDAIKEHQVLSLGWVPYKHAMGIAVGTVKMWGEVVEHRQGYRANFVKVQSLKQFITFDCDDTNIYQLRELYRVPADPDYFWAPWQQEEATQKPEWQYPNETKKG